MIRVFDPAREGILVPIISRQARLVACPSTGAREAPMNYVILEPGESNVPHRHADSEDTIFVIEGRGRVSNIDAGRAQEVDRGCIIHVPPGIVHAVTAETRMVSVGGPCPPDDSMLRR
jgi:quercetin dioxygenase-like cupin family protein